MGRKSSGQSLQPSCPALSLIEAGGGGEKMEKEEVGERGREEGRKEGGRRQEKREEGKRKQITEYPEHSIKMQVLHT